ncbi:MAG: PAS domain S-box protein [Oscillatoria princeps RMCB-10]|nr:PAS domain S-box protein [Oscillatoria princeps RMCB-10]
MLQTALASSGRLRALMAVGENLELCQKLEQIWHQTSQNTQDSPGSRWLVEPATVGCAAEPARTRQVESRAAEVRSSARALQLIPLAGVEASLLILSPCLNVWIQIEPAVERSDLESRSISQQNPPSSLMAETSETAPAWRVGLIFNPETIARLLSAPAVAAAAPHCSNLEPGELESHGNVLRRLWVLLLRVVGGDSPKETGNGQEVTEEPSTGIPSAIRPYPVKPAPAKNWLAPGPSSKNQKWPVPADSNSSSVNGSASVASGTQHAPTGSELFWEAPIGIVCESLDGGILSANPAFCRLTGYSETQLRHLDRRSITHPEDFAAEMRLIQHMLQEGDRRQTRRKRYLRGDGSIVWAEAVISLIGEEEEESYLLTFVTDLSERQRAELEIQQRRSREALLSEISAKIRDSFVSEAGRDSDHLDAILQTAVKRLREALDTDRVLAYQLFGDRSGVCVSENVNPVYPPMLGQSFPAECIPPPYLEAYRCGRLWSVDDVRAAGLAECHVQMLDQVRVRSMMAVAIQRTDAAGERTSAGTFSPSPLWGLLAVHHCHAPRCWTADEQQLLQAVANQIAIAIEQANLVHQLQAYARELEDRVSQRTRSLEQSLRFEQLIRQLTETLRQALDEDQMLEAAVEGLGKTLGVDGCYASLFDDRLEVLEVRYQHLSSTLGFAKSLVGERFSVRDWPSPVRERVFAGATCVQSVPIELSLNLRQALETSHVRGPSPSPSSGVVWQAHCPISDDRGLIGVLAVFHACPRSFEPAELELLKQVASQCAIAIRQARLYREEHQQRLSAEYFRLFLEQSANVFVEYDRQLRYLSINPAGASLLGRRQAEIIGKTNRELIGAQADTIEPLIRQVFDTGQKVVANHDVSTATGTRTFETVYAPISDASGTICRVIGIGSDVTEVRQQWQMLQEQNHKLAAINRLKEEFLANTSHELRTPLTAILGFSSVLLEESFGELNPKQKLYVDRICSSGQHLLELINDILDLSRIEANRLELEYQLVFIQDICESAIGLIHERLTNQGLTLEVDVDPDLDYLICDPRRLKQMLLNLLSNAIKFTPQGTVGLKIYRTRTPAGSHGACHVPTPEMIHFQVWDTGIGIDEADQLRLFSPFSQIDSSLSRQYQGTGLGLAIVRKLAEILGGSITLESSIGKGSRFTISLPLYQSPDMLPAGNTIPPHSFHLLPERG